jgi:hypothetical protein
MGTRINLLLDHDLADFRNTREVLARLAPTTNATEAVRDYWLASDPDCPDVPQLSWAAAPECTREPLLRRFTGPGSLFLSVTTSAAWVRTGGRWRGFLDIEPLRRVHLIAFRAIARALGASFMALYADSCEVNDLFWGGRPAWECVERMEQLWGPSQVEDVDSGIVDAADARLPFSVWFLEGVKRTP